ncbi:unnamed protein product [Prorocentrum cordatum]|uniref:Uncharacterized protein n=1 Tax=Prorocentrum cordatum TaxID=2364126 RepID=A0ABN9QUF1_9DINO|nr:unnamed protein product [Polarella glacialis]
MEKCDKQRSELAGVKTELKDKIVTEDAAARGAEQEQAVLERTQQLVRETGSLVQSALGTQLEELQKKQALFAEYFQDLLKEHLSYSEEQLRRLRARADAASTSEERGEVASAARAAEEAFGRFRTEHAETFSGIPEEVVITRLEGEFRAIVELVGSRRPPRARRRLRPRRGRRPRAVASRCWPTTRAGRGQRARRPLAQIARRQLWPLRRRMWPSRPRPTTPPRAAVRRGRSCEAESLAGAAEQ